ncbi:MAG TPA: PilT/PilU family type 4a pilus ATPase [Opitutales bacterium]|nr:PilT/PilU family type 4a pilus ATPase [Opitutales bacterium]
MLGDAGWVEDTNFLKEALEAAKQNADDGYLPPEIAGILIHSTQPETETGFPAIEQLEAMSPEELRSAVKALFRHCQSIGASDLHLSGGSRPRIRHHRKIVYLSREILPDGLARRMNFLLLTDTQKAQFEKEGDLDYALTLGNGEGGLRMRYRANLMLQKKGVSGVYRIVTENLQSLEELGFPNADTIRHLLTYHNGLILVTGPVNSGKTTTLATLVNELNESRQEHIITVEDPIEVMQESRNCIVTQREVGKHTANFNSALKSALREDPDIIVIGEMRDLETIEMAVTAAETGHLVIATMHTHDAESTLNRMLDVFPPNQQGQIRAMTAGSLRGILCQRLLPSTNDGVALACELMVNTPAVANIIRDGKETGLESAMQAGRKKGMRTMNESLEALVEAGKITEDVAKENRSHSDI